MDKKNSWSELPWHPDGNWAGRGYLSKENIRLVRETASDRGPAFENTDVADNAYQDILIELRAKLQEMRLKTKGPWVNNDNYSENKQLFN